MERESVFLPSRAQIEATNLMKFARKMGFDDLKSFYDFADRNPVEFWEGVVKDCGIEFDDGYTSVLDNSSGKPWTKWFAGGKVNVVHNAVSKHTSSLIPAIKYERESGETGEISYEGLETLTAKLAGGMASLGVKRGDRVGIFMPSSPEAVISLYAILRIGAVAVPIFSGYGSEAVQARVNDAGIRHILAYKNYSRRGKTVDMLSVLREINAVKIVYGLETEIDGLVDFQSLIERSDPVAVQTTSSEDPAIMLYTSGTTGKPKGTVHVHGGALVSIVKEVKYYMDMNNTDILMWISDPGWMMGPWSMIGANVIGGTIFLYDGALDFPTAERLWDVVEKNGVTLLGLSPTLVRSLRSKDRAMPLKGVRVFGSTGEPWDTESWLWLFEKLGSSKVPISNISGGTDIIGCFLASTPAIAQTPRCLYRGLGMGVSVYDENGNEVFDKIGYLVAKEASPSMTRGLWKQPEKYVDTYWKRFDGVWYHGDWASMDREGYFFLYGRADDVIKVAGKRVGPNEVEDLVSGVAGVVESAVVGIPDEVKGETLGVFYVSIGNKDLHQEVKKKVESSMGKSFTPGYVVRLDSIPKTKNGKIMRRVVRNAFIGEALGDTSGLEDQSAVEAIRKISAMMGYGKVEN
ncbi:MAG: AMP-binding protein [Candidatus Thermoplasmatota archaeon]|nr:AMP-binding protein [Candidatus Thermoplasmatota archaeon]